jgi:hypothetical protein
MTRAQMRDALLDHAGADELASLVRVALLHRPASARRW